MPTLVKVSIRILAASALCGGLLAIADRSNSRAQVFEILTGGDPTADRDEDSPWTASDNEGSDPLLTFVPLPQEMLDELKVDLIVRDIIVSFGYLDDWVSELDHTGAAADVPRAC